MTAYELAIIGSPTSAERTTLAQTIGETVDHFGLTLGRDVLIRDGTTVGSRDKHAATAAAYFGGHVHADVAATTELVNSSVPVIPTIDAVEDFSRLIPSVLHNFNGLKRRPDDTEMTELAVAMLECIGLLRRQRRVFISYRRKESRDAAVQLHDLLSARGFDVFLDTHDIRPADPFQEVLWHRLRDSDVLVMLDTATYFESKWTKHELGRARAMEIHILRVVWPEHTPNKLTALAETIHLDRGSLSSSSGPIVSSVADQIVLAVESLRSRSIAARHMSLTGRLRAEVEKIAASWGGVGAHRAIFIELADGVKIVAYPMVGVPTAELLNEVEAKTQAAGPSGSPILVYDHVGIREQWMKHLKWLDDKIRSVRAIRVSEAAYILAAWEP